MRLRKALDLQAQNNFRYVYTILIDTTARFSLVFGENVSRKFQTGYFFRLKYNGFSHFCLQVRHLTASKRFLGGLSQPTFLCVICKCQWGRLFVLFQLFNWVRKFLGMIFLANLKFLNTACRVQTVLVHNCSHELMASVAGSLRLMSCRTIEKGVNFDSLVFLSVSIFEKNSLSEQIIQFSLLFPHHPITNGRCSSGTKIENVKRIFKLVWFLLKSRAINFLGRACLYFFRLLRNATIIEIFATSLISPTKNGYR